MASHFQNRGFELPLLLPVCISVQVLLLPLSAGPSLEHYRTEYLQGASEAWLKTGKSNLKTDKNIPQLYLVVTGHSKVGAVTTHSGSWFQRRIPDGKKEHRYASVLQNGCR